MAAQSSESLLKEAQSVKETNPGRAEKIYHQILEESSKIQKAGSSTGNEQNLRDQEAALIKLGELYRDTKYVKLSTARCPLLICWERNAQGLAQVLLLSRSFMTSTAKAKTAKLSTSEIQAQLFSL